VTAIHFQLPVSRRITASVEAHCGADSDRADGLSDVLCFGMPPPQTVVPIRWPVGYKSQRSTGTDCAKHLHCFAVRARHEESPHGLFTGPDRKRVMNATDHAHFRSQIAWRSARLHHRTEGMPPEPQQLPVPLKSEPGDRNVDVVCVHREKALFDGRKWRLTVSTLETIISAK